MQALLKCVFRYCNRVFISIAIDRSMYKHSEGKVYLVGQIPLLWFIEVYFLQFRDSGLIFSQSNRGQTATTDRYRLSYSSQLKIAGSKSLVQTKLSEIASIRCYKIKLTSPAILARSTSPLRQNLLDSPALITATIARGQKQQQDTHAYNILSGGGGPWIWLECYDKTGDKKQIITSRF